MTQSGRYSARLIYLFITVTLLVCVPAAHAEDDPVGLSVMDVVSRIEAQIAGTEDPAVQRSLLVQLAAYNELAGDLEAAQMAYQRASFLVGKAKDFESLFMSAQLLYEIGEYRDAGAQARAIIATAPDSGVVLRATILLARSYVQQGKTEAFNEVIDTLSATGGSDIQVLTLFATLSGDLLDPAQIEKAREQLAELYPMSSEAALAAGEVSFLPSPNYIALAKGADVLPTYNAETVIPQSDEQVGASEEDADEAADAEDSADLTFETISIQTGSFTNPENAASMAEELRALDYEVTITSYTSEQATYHRVIVGGVGSDTVQSVLLTLKDHGYEGFPLYD